MNTLNLVRLNEYEVLMAQLEVDKKKFKKAFRIIHRAVMDIIYVYGHTQRQLRTPGRPLSFAEFLVLHSRQLKFTLPKPDYDVFAYSGKVKEFEKNLEIEVGAFIKRFWNFESQFFDVQLFLNHFAQRVYTIWLIKYYFGSNFASQLAPPNFEELLRQILDHRKSETKAAKTKKEGGAK